MQPSHQADASDRTTADDTRDAGNEARRHQRTSQSSHGITSRHCTRRRLLLRRPHSQQMHASKCSGSFSEEVGTSEAIALQMVLVDVESPAAPTSSCAASASSAGLRSCSSAPRHSRLSPLLPPPPLRNQALHPRRRRRRRRRLLRRPQVWRTRRCRARVAVWRFCTSASRRYRCRACVRSTSSSCRPSRTRTWHSCLIWCRAQCSTARVPSLRRCIPLVWRIRLTSGQAHHSKSHKLPIIIL